MSEQELHTIILKRLDDMEIAQGKRFKAIEDKIDPMYDLFTATAGFSRVAVLILKAIASIGAAILAFYVIIEFFKRLGR